MKISAKSLLWFGSVIISLSIALQFVGLLLPSPTWSKTLTLIGLGVNSIGVPLTIWQSYRSALEEQRRLQYVYDRTQEGRIRRNIGQLQTEMHMKGTADKSQTKDK